MFRNTKPVLLLAIILAIFSSSLFAKEQRPVTVKMGSGGTGGTYYPMMKDVVDFCSYDSEAEWPTVAQNVTLENTESEGGVFNLLGMGNKTLTAGLVPEDVLRFYAKRTPDKVNMRSIKAVMGMHIETGHLLIPKGYRPTQPEGTGANKSAWDKMWDAVSKKKTKKESPTSISVDLLKNQQIAAWGGSVVSARALSVFLGLKAQVKSIDFEAAKTSNIPVLAVGGQPYPPVQELLDTGRFTLVAIDYSKLQSSAPFYVQIDANYIVDGNPVSVPTFGVRAVLLAKNFRRASSNKPMIDLASCMSDVLIDLADDPGTNANWTSVYDMHQKEIMIDWDYFDLP